MLTFKICPNFLELLSGLFSWPVLLACLAAALILAGYLPFFRKADPARQQAMIRKARYGALFLLAFPVLLESLATLVLSYTNHCFGKLFAGETGAMLVIGMILLATSGVLVACRKNNEVPQ